MKRYLLYYPCLLLLVAMNTVTAAPEVQSFVSNHLHFIENKGQITDQHGNPRPDIDFKIAAGNGLNVFIGAGQIHYQWSHSLKTDGPQTDHDNESAAPTVMYRMDVTLLDANAHAEVVAEEPQEYCERYYLSALGLEGVKAGSYRKIVYKDVYPHIDWIFYINKSGQVEHDFVVRPGGKVSDIKLQYAGASELRINNDGSITAVTPLGTVKEHAPYCFQQDGRQVAGRFVLENNMLSFATAEHVGVLTIDPVLEWGTYFGGGEVDRAEGITLDKHGNAYITGRTNSLSNLATVGSFQDTFAGGNQATGAEAFIAKFDPQGWCLWATYYGGERVDVALRVASDTTGSVYIAGYTNSGTGIATAGTHQSAKAGTATSYDAFLAKFDSSGQRMWGTYFGGTGADGNTTIAVACGSNGHVYLTGNTQSATGIATPNAFRSTRPGGQDMFLAKFTTSGMIDWSTYYGGAGNDFGASVTVDPFGNVLVAGYTQSDTGIATIGTHQSTFAGGRDAFLVKFDSNGQRQWGTYFGGNDIEEAYSVAANAGGDVLMVGVTRSDTGIATAGSHQPLIAEQTYGDGFCARFSSSGTRVWGTYYGGASADGIMDVQISNDNEIYFVGQTRSTVGIATPDGFQPNMIGSTPEITCGLLVKMDMNGQRLWGTYYGGVDHDEITGVGLDGKSNVYFSGAATSGSNIATANSYQPTLGGGNSDCFLVKFNDCAPPPAPDTIIGPVSICKGREALFTAAAAFGAVSYTWIVPVGWTGQSHSDTIALVPSGSGGQLRVAAHSACGGTSDTVGLQVSVSPIPVLIPSGYVPICFGDSLELQAEIPMPVTYTWLHNGIPVPGSSSGVHRASAAGTYQVISNNGICQDTSLPATVQVNPLPEPVIVYNNGILATTQSYTTYQWYYNGTPVTGATAATFTVTAEGDYSVKVTDTNACVGTSEILAIGDNLVTLHPGSQHLIHFYPNPVKDEIHVLSSVPAMLNVYTSEGKFLVRGMPIIIGSTELDTKSWSPGLYLLRIRDHKGNILLNEKVLKQ
jgi:hypothetical protein